jgi:hypothetical protein
MENYDEPCLTKEEMEQWIVQNIKVKDRNAYRKAFDIPIKEKEDGEVRNIDGGGASTTGCEYNERCS